ncbi:hypothetical protein EYC80_007560 [Monilinia laxa]|uniref:Uncharacterized protein n=1 Tax=Monilinia laxa TaxID=61186 RepID=A0A5N6JWA3_MONLA|nr:hypothetical protein EYC80_007560 [Monilinia laxa]
MHQYLQRILIKIIRLTDLIQILRELGCDPLKIMRIGLGERGGHGGISYNWNFSRGSLNRLRDGFGGKWLGFRFGGLRLRFRSRVALAVGYRRY